MAPKGARIAPAKRKRSAKAAASDASDGSAGSQPPTKKAAKRAAGKNLDIPASKKRKGDTTCSRCGAKSSAVDFHKVSGGDSGLVNSTCCMRCFKRFELFWAKLYSWPEVCGKCSAEKSFNDEFDKSCNVLEAGGAVGELTMGSETKMGYRLKHNLIFVDEKDFATTLGAGSTPWSLGVSMEKFEQPFGEQWKGASSNILRCQLPRSRSSPRSASTRRIHP